ncbi:ATP-binding protein [Cytobacillus praedii]|uniref:ATP-binding protein n=1 Tax=Cytobacillus praedii TaxID=1742358 RepID=UPI003AF7DD26
MVTVEFDELKYLPLIRKTNELSKYLLEGSSSPEHFVINLNKITWIDPSGAVLLIDLIERLKNANNHVEFIPLEATWKPAISYGLNMGIFQKLGLSNALSYEHGETYIAPTKITRQDVFQLGEGQGNSIETYYERLTDLLVKKILRNKNSYDEKVVRVFTYTIREVIRNIFDHSEADNFYYASQYIPFHNVVEVVISDNGIGLVNTIPFDIEEKWMDKDTSEEAIRKALTPGLTAGSNHSYAHQDYKNSGYGLPIIKRILKASDGVLSIATGDCSITFNSHHVIVRDCNIKGTNIRMRINLSELKSVDPDYEMEEAMKEAKELGLKTTPSKASSNW